MKLVGKWILLLTLITAIWYVLDSTDGVTHKFVFGLTNFTLLGFWFHIIRHSFTESLPVFNFLGLSMVGFGLVLIVLTATNRHEGVYLHYIPYAILISYTGFVLMCFGTFNPEEVFTPGGYLDRHPVLSITFSLVTFLVVLGCVLMWAATLLA